MKHNWEYKKLGEVCKIIGGSTPKTNIPSYWNGSHPWITPAELDGSKYIERTERYLTDDALAHTNLQLLPIGTVLLSSRAPIGKLAITKIPMYCNQGFKNVVVGNKLISEFVYWYLTFKRDYIVSLGRGATFKEISKSITEQIPIPLPPLPIQQKIVAELDKVSLIIDKKKQQLKELDKLAQAIFYDMFGDPDEIFTKWNYLTLEEVCLNIVDCPHTTPIKSETPTKYPCIRTSELKNGTIHWDTMQYVSEDEYNNRISRLIPQNGDIVYGREGSFGDAVILPYGWYFCLGQRTMLFRANCDIVNIIFLHRVLISEVVFRQAKDKNVASTVAHVNVKDIKKFLIPLPPLALQQSFAAKIEAIEKQKELISRSIKEAQTLFDERMDYWFD